MSLGAGPGRVLFVHLLPACRGAVAAQALLLLPGFILAEATLPLDLFMTDLKTQQPPAVRVPGTAVFMSGDPYSAPPALLANLRAHPLVQQQVAAPQTLRDFALEIRAPRTIMHPNHSIQPVLLWDVPRLRTGV